MRQNLKKLFILLFIFAFNFSFAQETINETIKAGIKFNESTARIEAFKDIQTKVEKDIFKDFLKDPNKEENIKHIKNSIFTIKNERYLCPFYVKNTLASYSVTYMDNMKYTFYYNILGNLIKFDSTPTDDSYPTKTYSYSRYGNLISVTFTVDEDEQFVYNKSGKLLAHWLGNNIIKKTNALKFIDIKRGGDYIE